MAGIGKFFGLVPPPTVETVDIHKLALCIANVEGNRFQIFVQGRKCLTYVCSFPRSYSGGFIDGFHTSFRS